MEIVVCRCRDLVPVVHFLPEVDPSAFSLHFNFGRHNVSWVWNASLILENVVAAAHLFWPCRESFSLKCETLGQAVRAAHSAKAGFLLAIFRCFIHPSHEATDR